MASVMMAAGPCCKDSESCGGCAVHRPDYMQHEKDEIQMDIMREITSLWQTDELRRHKPTPVDGEKPQNLLLMGKEALQYARQGEAESCMCL